MELEYPNISIFELVKRASNKYSNNIAYNYFGNICNYKDFIKKVEECAKSLKQLGIKQNDVITICMPNTPEAIIAFYAINMIGAIANMIHPLSAENEIKYYLNVSNSIMLITIDIAWNKIKNILKDTKIEKSVVLSVKESMPFILGIGYSLTKGRKIKDPEFNDVCLNWKDFIAVGKSYTDELNANLDGTCRAVILYTGGTTGLPKGIVLSNLNFNAIAMQGFKACGCLKEGYSFLAIMPIFHGFGLGICIHTTLYFGGTAIILPQFNGKTFHKLLIKYKPNILGGVPTLYEALLKNKKMKNVDLSFIKCAVSGGDSLSVSLKHKIDAFLEEHNAKIEIREGYGLTECVTGSCLIPEKIYKENSIGLPYPDMHFKIVKPNTDILLPYGEVGEIVLTGPSVMIEYLNDIEETNKTLQKHEDGLTWLHTGDLGYMDEEGFVYFKQRLKRMIVSSGYNIYPQYIENIIDSHPDVLMSTVIGIDHPYKKQVPKAYIVLKNNIKPTEEIKTRIYEHCEKNIAKYSMPCEIEYRESLPKTLVGKIDYNNLIEEEKKKVNVKNDEK